MSGKSPGAKRRRLDKNASSPDAQAEPPAATSKASSKRSREGEGSDGSVSVVVVSPPSSSAHHYSPPRLHARLSSGTRATLPPPSLTFTVVGQEDEGEVISAKRIKTVPEVETNPDHAGPPHTPVTKGDAFGSSQDGSGKLSEAEGSAGGERWCASLHVVCPRALFADLHVQVHGCEAI